MAQPDTSATTIAVEDEEFSPLELLQFYANNKEVTEHLEQGLIDTLGQDCLQGYELDKASIADWRNELLEIRKLASQSTEGAKTYPWPNASNVKYPLITQAALEFNARAYPVLINDGNIVKAKIEGDDEAGAKAARKDRVTKYMSYQVMDKMPHWETDHDKLLMAVPTDGVAFKKVYFDPLAGDNVSEFVPADNLVVSRSTKHLGSCPRASHIVAYYPYEITENIGAGLWRDADIPIQNPELQEPVNFIEQHILYDLDGDGYPEPYIVTFHEETGKVVRVRANYSQEDIMLNNAEEVVKVSPTQYFVKYECFPDPDGGFYGKGIGALIKPINDSVNSILNQMIDAGHLANTQGGFLGKGFNVKSGSTRFTPGEWKKTDVMGGALKDNILPLPVAQPSNVLFALLGMLIESGKGIASIQDVMTGGGGQNMPATSVLAMIEQGTKVYTAIFKRLFHSMKEEFTLIYNLNGLYLDPQEYIAYIDFKPEPPQEGQTEQQYRQYVQDNTPSIADFEDDTMDITPQADPRMATDMQRMAKAQLLREDLQLPWVNGPEVTKEAWEVAGIDDPERFIKPPSNKPSPEQLEKLAEIEIKKKDAESKRITAVAGAVEKLAKAGITGENNIMNMLELQIIKDEIENAEDERRPVQGLEG